MPSPQVLQAVIDANPLGVIYVDREGLIRLWNPAAEALFGHPAEAVLGQSLDLIIPDKLRQAHWDGFHRAMETGVARLGGRFLRTRAVHRDGSRVYVEMAFGLVTGEHDAMQGAVAYCRPAAPPATS